jgi:hypothetical protein
MPAQSLLIPTTRDAFPPRTIKKTGDAAMNKSSSAPLLGDAQRLVDEYCQLLTSLNEMLPLGVPDSLLPAPVAEIRAAIVVLAKSQPASIPEDTNAERLRTAFLASASFLSYEEANDAARLQRAFAQGDRAFIASPRAARCMARAQRIESDTAALAREYDELVVGPKTETDGLLAEVDQFLAEFGRKRVPSPRD